MNGERDRLGDKQRGTLLVLGIGCWLSLESVPPPVNFSPFDLPTHKHTQHSSAHTVKDGKERIPHRDTLSARTHTFSLMTN